MRYFQYAQYPIVFIELFQTQKMVNPDLNK